MSSLELRGIIKRYGAQTVVDQLDLDVHAGEFVSLLGPSGCGKTTLLRIVAGLASADAGIVRVDGRDVTRLPAHQRNIGVVFQSYALFPHLTVGENIAFGMKARGEPKAAVVEAVHKALRSVQMSSFADRPISALSGGQQQRVAVARAIATRPGLILLDEPLSALDRKLRETMQVELRQLLRDAGMTAIFVTHDQEEALVMSDRIAVMNHGAIEQLDAPESIYAQPGTEFILNFVGLSSQWRGTLRGTSVTTTCGSIEVPQHRAQGLPDGASVLVGVRPEHVRLGRGDHPVSTGMNSLLLTVSQTVYRGTNRLVYFVTPDGGAPLLAECPANSEPVPNAGDTLSLRWPVECTLLFPVGSNL